MALSLDNILFEAIQERNLEEVENFFQAHPNFSSERRGFLCTLIETLPIEQEIAKERRIADLLLAHGTSIDGIDSLSLQFDRDPPLFLAARVNKLHLVEHFLQKGANVHLRRKDGETILHHLAFFNRPDSVPLLLQHKAEMEARDAQGRTPLHVAIAHERTSFAACLLANRADISAQNSTGLTPIMLAATSHSANVIPLLTHAGANPNEPYLGLDVAHPALLRKGDTPLHATIRSFKLKFQMTNALAQRTSLLETERTLTALFQAKADPFLPNAQGETTFDVVQKLEEVQRAPILDCIQRLTRERVASEISSSSPLFNEIAGIVAQYLC